MYRTLKNVQVSCRNHNKSIRISFHSLDHIFRVILSDLPSLEKESRSHVPFSGLDAVEQLTSLPGRSAPLSDWVILRAELLHGIQD